MADPKPTTLHHPSIPGVTQEIPAGGDVEAWTEQGWRKTPLK